MDMNLFLVIFGSLVFVAVAGWYFRRGRSPDPTPLERLAIAPEALTEVRIDADRLVAFHPVNGEAAIALSDVVAVAIDTDDTGPWGSDLHWVVQGEHGHVVVPIGATGEELLLSWVQAQPGVDNEAIVSAMASTTPARFLVWQKPSPVATG